MIQKFSLKNLKGLICQEPFDGISVSSQGEVRLCHCGAWQPTVVGNILNNTLEEILSSNLAIDIRKSIIDGTYEYCNEKRCGIIINKKLTNLSSFSIEDQTRFTEYKKYTLPRFINLAGDKICNLSCPSCRHKVITLEDAEAQKNIKVVEMLNSQIFNSSSTQPIELTLSSEGEVFASPLMLKFLEEFPIGNYPNAKFLFQTNGTLLINRWDKIKHLENHIFKITITVDGASPLTYEKLRRGGNFESIIKNLDFIKYKKEQLGFNLALRMVVQYDNINEIEDFCLLGNNYNADSIEFQRILQWGTYSIHEFDQIDVLNEKHPLYVESINKFRIIKSKFNNLLFYSFDI